VEVLDAGAAADKDAAAGAAAAAAAGRKVDPSQRVTTRYMTKYEKARILGTRALQLRCAALGVGVGGGG
jgi:DNA-directed RNA polymerase I, II, and III subunit RPABC2